MVVRTAKGEVLSDEQWKTRAHDLVFDALQRRLEDVTFPATRERVMEAAADAKVAEDPEIRLRPFLETLPSGTYETGGAVSTALNRTWHQAKEAPT